MAASVSIPNVVLFTACESIQRDLTTGLLSMTGVPGSGQWFVDRQKFPSAFGRLFVYVVMTDVHGEFKFDLRLSPLNGDRGGRYHCIVRAPSPMDYCETMVPVGHWQIDRDGEYAFELLHRETPFATRRFTARTVDRRPLSGPGSGKGDGGPKK